MEWEVMVWAPCLHSYQCSTRSAYITASLHDLMPPWLALNSLCRQEEGGFNYSIKTETIMSGNYSLNILFVTKLYVY